MPNMNAKILKVRKLWQMLKSRSKDMVKVGPVMTNVKVFQKYIKSHGQVQGFQIYGTVGKTLSQGTHMPNIYTLYFRIKQV